MTTVLQNPSQSPSVLTLVNRVLSECGVEQISTLAGTTFPPAIVALNALNDCVSEIYSRNRWEWQQALAYITLLDGVGQYALPADFGRMAQSCVWNGNNLSEKTLEEWYQTVVPLAASTGQPFQYCANNNILRINPVPNATTISIAPLLNFMYYRSAPAYLTTASNSAVFDVPPDFNEALVVFAKYKVKQHLEYPDWQTEATRYERCIQIQLAKTAQARRKPRMRQGGSTFYNTWW